MGILFIFSQKSRFLFYEMEQSLRKEQFEVELKDGYIPVAVLMIGKIRKQVSVKHKARDIKRKLKNEMDFGVSEFWAGVEKNENVIDTPINVSENKKIVKKLLGEEYKTPEQLCKSEAQFKCISSSPYIYDIEKDPKTKKIKYTRREN